MHALLLSWLLLQGSAVPEGDDPRVTPEVRVVRMVAPAVVYLEATREVFAGISARTLTALTRKSVTGGTGIVIEKSGYIVTNYHVIANAKEITVQFDTTRDSKVYVAQLVSAVPSEDLALLKIKGEQEFPVVTLGTSSDLMIGEKVIAIGNPFSQRLSVSSGIVSGLHRNLQVAQDLSFPDLIQTDAAINQGNSGGPLLNIYGELVGMNSAVTQGAENMGFAIPVDRIKEVLSEELLAPSAARAYLGFEVSADNLAVTRISPGSPSESSGLQLGDRIRSIDGEATPTFEEYTLRRLPVRPGQPVVIEVLRGGKSGKVTLTGWSKADGILLERLGMTVDRSGIGNFPLVRVERVAPGGPAAQLGLKPDDVIEALRDGASRQTWVVASGPSLARFVDTLPAGRVLEFDILRDDNADGQLDRGTELYRGTLTVR